MKYAVSNEGVEALRGMATAITEAKEEIMSHAGQLRAATELPNLGPHSEELTEAAEMIEQAVNGASEPIEEIADKLNDVADGYEEVIDFKRFTASLGN